MATSLHLWGEGFSDKMTSFSKISQVLSSVEQLVPMLNVGHTMSVALGFNEVKELVLQGAVFLFRSTPG